MILTNQQIQSLLNEQGIYDCRLMRQRFASKILDQNVSPLGDIFCFEAPVIIGPVSFNNAIVVAGELPNTDSFGGICFQRLYATLLGSLLSSITGENYFVNQSSMFVGDMQASLSFINQVKDAVVFHLVLPIETDVKEFHQLKLKEAELEQVKASIVDSFHFLTRSIFVETRRDAF